MPPRRVTASGGGSIGKPVRRVQWQNRMSAIGVPNRCPASALVTPGQPFDPVELAIQVMQLGGRRTAPYIR